MFPIPWNFPFRKKNGDMSTIGAEIGGAGSELPPHGVGDAGKLLGVKPNGSLEWSDTVNSEIQTLTNNLSDEVETRAKLGAHNLLPNTASTEEKNGITFTVNSDGSVTVSGTATAETSKNIFTNLPLNGNYILSGCPAGGSSSDSTGYNFQAQIDDLYGHVDIGNGHAFSVSTKVNRVLIHIANGTVISTPITFYPMIRLATDTNPAYQPYAMTNRELTESVNGLKMKHIVKQITLTANDITILDLSSDFALPSGSKIQSLQLALSADNTINSSSMSLPYCHLSTGDVKTWVERFNPDGSNVKIINLTSEWTNYYLHAVAFYT